MRFAKEEVESLIETKLNDYTKKFGKEFRIAVLEIVSLEKSLIPEVKPEKHSRVIALSEWNKHHPYPTVRALRQYYYDKENNGFDYCVERGGNKGGRILINEDKYFEWLENRDKFTKI